MTNLFKHYIKTDNIIFKYAAGPSEKDGKEIHTFNEIILFLKGDALLIGENIHTKIEPNTLIVIPKETYHQVIINDNPENYLRCTLSFFDNIQTEKILKDINQIHLLECDLDFSYIFEKLIKNAKCETSVSQDVLNAFLTLILFEIKNKKDNFIKETPQTEFITAVINYINQNLDKSVSISKIAKQCNTSQSSLSHIFKKEMNISIHKYIIKKRLILAHHKIKDGTAATTAALESGFKDYSGFYKQYKNMFGYPPSKNNHK